MYIYSGEFDTDFYHRPEIGVFLFLVEYLLIFLFSSLRQVLSVFQDSYFNPNSELISK